MHLIFDNLLVPRPPRGHAVSSHHRKLDENDITNEAAIHGNPGCFKEVDYTNLELELNIVTII